jgi:hydroxymethylbilane synthase
MTRHSRQNLTIGTRKSKLALWQTHRIIELLNDACHDLECDTRTYVTEGDEVTDTPLTDFSEKGVFTTLLERALREKEIDIAVHSMKDLPIAENGGLSIGAITTRTDARDALVARNGWTLATLPQKSIVGTSSIRRQAQLLAVRDDLIIRSIRGNVDTRVRKVLEGQFDATVLAAAGLQRLGLTEHVAEWLPFDIMLPAPGQGALAVQCRADDRKTLELLKVIDDAAVRNAVTAERMFLEGLGGGCSLPIAAFAAPRRAGGPLWMRGLVISPNGREVVRVEGTCDDGRELGGRLANEAKRLGAAAILSRVDTESRSPTTPPPRGAAGRTEWRGVPAARKPGGQTDNGHAGGSANKPLSGRRIVVTRARHQAKTLVDRLSDLGATTLLMSAIEIVPVSDAGPLDDAIRSLAVYDWVVFTSANAVEIFCDRVTANHLTDAVFEDVDVAAVGPSTAEALSERRITPAFVPQEFVAERIADDMGDVRGLHVLLPRADIARKTLPQILEARGAVVKDMPVYRTQAVNFDRHQIDELRKGIDVITFTSGSTVRSFVAGVRKHEPAIDISKDTLIACIGPVTADVAREIGLNVGVMPSSYTTEGLIDELVEHFQGARK